MSLPQLIQTVSAVDQDDPHSGQHFYYSLAPEAANNPNFTIRDNQGNGGTGTYQCFLIAWAGYFWSYTMQTVSKVTCSSVAVGTFNANLFFKSFISKKDKN